MIFLKWGGSLITHKDRPGQARPDTLNRLAHELLRFQQEKPDAVVLLGHGSGSFGHVKAERYGTQRGVQTPGDWHGFVEVWRSAHELHRLVLAALEGVELSAFSFPPSASAIAEDGVLVEMASEPIKRAGADGLLPVVMGDVAMDRVRGGSIISTEAVFSYLAPILRPRRILLAGIEPGVYRNYSRRDEIIELIEHPENLGPGLTGAGSPDVTGGMADKVQRSLKLTAAIPGLQVRIFSADQPEALFDALMGKPFGTLIRAPQER